MPGNQDNETGTDILKRKKASIKQAPLPAGSPSWGQIEKEKWKDIKKKAKQGKTGYRAIRKLLSDKRFDKP